jgi:membrane associated rhomboid family serine protease
MGIADRDYSRADYDPARAQRAVGRMAMWSVTTWLLVINIVAYILSFYLIGLATLPDGQPVRYSVLMQFGSFTVADAVYRIQIWRFISFQFLHDQQALSHILFNMFALYMFGGLIEQFLGRRRFLAFYLICGIGGGVMYVVLTMLGFFGASAQLVYRPLVGASAGIFGLLVASAAIAPNATVLLWGSIPIKLKTFAYVMLGVAVFTIFSRGFNAGGEAAHLGGAIVGYFLIRRPQLLNFFESGFAKNPRLDRR